MILLVYAGRCGAVGTTDPPQIGYYIVKFTYDPVTLQEDNNTDG